MESKTYESEEDIYFEAKNVDYFTSEESELIEYVSGWRVEVDRGRRRNCVLNDF